MIKKTFKPGNVFGMNYHPIVMGIYPVLSLYVHNRAQLQGVDIVGSLIVIWIFTMMLWLLINGVIRNIQKARIIVSTFIIFFFSYGHVKRSLYFIFQNVGIMGAFRFSFEPWLEDNSWLVLWFSLLISIAILISLSKSSLYSIDRFYTFLAITATVSVMVVWLVQLLQEPRSGINAYVNSWVDQIEAEEVVPSSSGLPPTLPDIYYIVVDGFTRSDILQQYFGYDNSDILQQFEEKGFFIGNKSSSNYAYTELSLSSTLNFMYLFRLSELIGEDTRSSRPVEVMLEQNRVFHRLRDHGYKIISFYDEYPITNITGADIYLNPHKFVLNGFQNELINTTPLPAVLRYFSLKNPYDVHRETIHFIFDHISDAAQMEGSQFVFAHILAPHPPFVFGPDGEPIQPDRDYALIDEGSNIIFSSPEEYIAGYRGQAAFLMKRLVLLVDEILASSPEPPIIIIQGDHGSGLMLDRFSYENSNVHERMSILNVYYFPNQDYSRLYAEITPINSFRVIFDQYFGTDFGLLDDKNYFTTVDQPYRFFDVTGVLSAD